MNQMPFGQIKQYGVMLAITNRLFRRGLITSVEYDRLTMELQKKYCLAFCSTTGNVLPRKNQRQTEALGKEDFKQ